MVGKLKQNLANINIAGDLCFDEPMAQYTTFQVGGPADVYVRPESARDVGEVLRVGRENGTPVFTLGGGANILVSDAGIRGIVMDMRSFNEVRADGKRPGAEGPVVQARVGAGLAVSAAAADLADRGLAGLDFLYAMPGSVGGAVWMNARCYGSSIIDILSGVDVVTAHGAVNHYVAKQEDFAYKVSPFQPEGPLSGAVIVAAHLTLREEASEQIWLRMREHEQDRSSKGHFSGPSAGSVFKNNRAFGKPSGQIIDSLDLRGYQIGGARISDQHANIIINAGGATAADIRALIEHIQGQVKENLGFNLEPEVLLIGDWSSEDGRIPENAAEPVQRSV